LDRHEGAHQAGGAYWFFFTLVMPDRGHWTGMKVLIKLVALTGYGRFFILFFYYYLYYYLLVIVGYWRRLYLSLLYWVGEGAECVPCRIRPRSSTFVGLTSYIYCARFDPPHGGAGWVQGGASLAQTSGPNIDGFPSGGGSNRGNPPKEQKNKRKK
jgi:hypothetical protein